MMSLFRDYKRLTERELLGRKVRALQEIRNGWGSMPAGTVFIIERKFKGFALRAEPCTCCGFRFSVNKVSPGKVEWAE